MELLTAYCPMGPIKTANTADYYIYLHYMVRYGDGGEGDGSAVEGDGSVVEDGGDGGRDSSTIFPPREEVYRYVRESMYNNGRRSMAKD